MNKVRTKILHIVPSLNVGGREKILLEMVRRSDRERFDIGVGCLKNAGALSDKFLMEGIEVTAFNKKKVGVDKGLYFRLAKYFKEQRADIIHVHNPGVLVYAFVAATLARVRTVVNTEHGLEYPERGFQKIASTAFRNSIAMNITVSRDLERQLSRQMVFKNKIMTIHNGIDASVYTNQRNAAQIRKSYSISPTDRVIGNVARLSRVKNHGLLIRAMKKVVEAVPQAKLLIVGDGELRGELVALTKELGLDENVIFHGLSDNVPELMQIMDIYVLSSTNEGISITVLEAMASGKAVVATDVGGNPEVVVDGQTGILVPSGDHDRLTGAVIELLRDGKMAAEMGRKGRARVGEHFNLDQMVRKIEGIYLDLLHVDRPMFSGRLRKI